MNDERTPLLTTPADDIVNRDSVESTYNNQIGTDGSNQPQETEQTKGFKDFFLILSPLIIGVFLAAMDVTIVVSAYASIGSELEALQSTSWLATAYLLTSTSFQPLYGRMSDIFGRKECLLFAYALFGVGSGLCGLSGNIVQLIAARALAGIGGGGMMTVVAIIVSDLVPLRSRGTWQGLLNIVFSVGQASGAPLGGLFSDTIGWRWAFYFQVPIAVLAFISVFFALRMGSPVANENLMSKFKRVDFLGSGVLVFAVFSLLLGLERGVDASYTSPEIIGLLVGSLLLFIYFIIVEAKISVEPLAPIRIMINPSLLAAYLANFFAFASIMQIMFNISLYYQAVELLSAKQAGLGLLPGVFAGVTGSLFSGVIMQKTGKYYVLTVISYSIMVLGSLIIYAATKLRSHTLVVNYIGLFVMNFGNGIGVTTTLIALIANASPEDQAVVIAVSYLFRSLGVVVGISGATALVQASLKISLSKKLVGRNAEELVRHIRESLDYVNKLDPETRGIVRMSYKGALQVAFFTSVITGVITVLCSFFIKEKPLSRK